MKNQLYFNFRSLLIPVGFFLIPLSWYLGTNIIRFNMSFIQKSITHSEVFEKMYDAINGFSVFVNGTSSFYLVGISILLCGLLWSNTFLYDKNSGFGNFQITRAGFRKYYFNKLFSIAMSCFGYVFSILTIIFICSLIVYSCKYPSDLFNADMVNTTITDMFYRTPYTISFLLILTIAIQVTLYVLLGYGCSLFITNRFLGGLMPFIIYLSSIIIPQIFSFGTFPAKILSWIFPEYLSGFFLINEFWYTPFPITGTYFIHLAVLLIPTILICIALYFKNKKAYIK